MSATKLYRHFARDGTLLYVGVAAVGYSRQAVHLGNAKWADLIARIDLEDYPTRAAALAAERDAIAKERPIYNVNHNTKAAKYRSPRTTMVSVRIPDALLQAVDRVVAEDAYGNRTQAIVVLLENALIEREK